MVVQRDEFIDAGERVLVRMHQTGRGAASGVRVDADFWIVYRLAAGAITKLAIFSDRGEAMDAAGIGRST